MKPQHIIINQGLVDMKRLESMKEYVLVTRSSIRRLINMKKIAMAAVSQNEPISQRSLAGI